VYAPLACAPFVDRLLSRGRKTGTFLVTSARSPPPLARTGRSRYATSASTTGPGVSSGGSSGTFDADRSVSSSYAYALTNGSYNLHAPLGSLTASGTYSVDSG